MNTNFDTLSLTSDQLSTLHEASAGETVKWEKRTVVVNAPESAPTVPGTPASRASGSGIHGTASQRHSQKSASYGVRAARTAIPIDPNVRVEGNLGDDRSTIAPKMPDADYLLQKRVGEGGQGEVWRAWQASLRREVAIKRLLRGSMEDFLQEAFTTGELEHPNIVPVHELSEAEFQGQPQLLLAMKLVRGRSWQDVLDETRKAADFSLEGHLAKHLPILINVCNAVAYAHAKGIIHRDLKPAQVMLGEFGEVYLMDWGLAVCAHTNVPVIGEGGLTKFRTVESASNMCGTPAYMAPEQLEETTERIGLHTDIYLLGAILYTIVTGRPPHSRGTAIEAMIAAKANQYAPVGAQTPAELRATIERALQSDPAKRHGSVAEFRAELEAYLSGAGRRDESQQIALQVEKDLAAIANAPDYDRFQAVEQTIARALMLWADNPKALWLKEQARHAHAEFAMRSGDLNIARSLARSLFDEAERAELLTAIDKRERELTAHRKQRRILLAAIAVLVLAGGGGIAAYFVEQHDEQAKQLATLDKLKQSAIEWSVAADKLDADPNVDPQVKYITWQNYNRTFEITGHGTEHAKERLAWWERFVRARDAFEAAQQLDGSADATPADKFAVWNEYVTTFEPAKYRLDAAKARRDFWNVTRAANEEFAKLRTLDGDKNASPSAKIESWRNYLSVYGESGPNADVAKARIAHWQSFTGAESAFAETMKIDGDPVLRPSVKYAAWKKYMAAIGPEGHRYADAEQRLIEWHQKFRPFDIGNGETVAMVPLPAGTFNMGSPSSEADREADEGPVTQVTISAPFLISETEVTNRQWRAVMGSTPNNAPADDNPVTNVSWTEAMAFCRALSEATGQAVSLPTEAQWEYACRAGTASAYSFGNDAKDLPDYAWYAGNNQRLQRVGTKRPNPFGLYDMHGNAAEWCLDWASASLPGGASTDPKGPLMGERRTVRGGSVLGDARQLRSANRGGAGPSERFPDVGFRFVVPGR